MSDQFTTTNAKLQAQANIDQLLSKMPPQIKDALKRKLESTIFYVPKIGIMGKSGAGKSSLANAIVGKPAFATGGVGGCTRQFQEATVQIGARQIVFVDLPGIAENITRQAEYEALYKEKAKELDVILWAVKVDDRANVDDQKFYEWLIQHYPKGNIMFVLTQSDKAAPSRGWNYDRYQPSEEQKETIELNRHRLAKDFQVSLSDVVAVACEYLENKKRFDRFQIDKLITHIIYKIPSQAKSSFYASVEKENRTQEAKQEAIGGFTNVVNEAIDYLIDLTPLPEPVKKIAKSAKTYVVDGVKNLWDKLFG